MSVRPARPPDAERVARVQLETWRTAYADLLPPAALDVPEVHVAAGWLNAVESPQTPGHRVLVALDGDELVGVAASTPAEDDDLEPADAGELSTVELSTLLVAPRWGRRGHGARLVAASVESWRRDGASYAVCWAWQRDPATRSFLTSAGWAQDGATRGLDTGERVEHQLRLHTDLREDG